MDSKRKNLSLGEVIRETRGDLMQVLVYQPIAWLALARGRFENLPKTNFDLGCQFAARGQWVDALFRFRVAAYFAPDYPQVWYNLGCCYYRTGKRAKAVEALKKAVAQRPDHTEAVFMLAAIDAAALPPAQVPKRMPEDMVVRFFTRAAENYDIEESRAQYQAGKVTFEALKPFVKASAPRVVDLGCGTGIAARPWRETAASITGIDGTPAMLALAEKATHAGKKLFDHLRKADLAAPMDGVEAADAVLVVNVAPFVGDLTGLVQTAGRALAPGGVMLLTTEPFAGSGFGLSAETGRFGHSAEYVKHAARAAGLTLAKELRLPLYAGTETPAYIFTKATNG